MLAILKDIFWPTRKKLVYAALVGPALTLVGMFAMGLNRHGPDIVDYMTLPLSLPYWVVGWLNFRGQLALLALLAFAFLYWYIIFSICGHLFARIFGTR